MRLLPAYQLYRRLRKQNHSLKIGFRVSRGQTPEDSMLQEPEIGMGKCSPFRRGEKNKEKKPIFAICGVDSQLVIFSITFV